MGVIFFFYLRFVYLKVLRSYRGEKKTMESESNGILANFRCDCYCRKSVETEKREKIVDFEVGVSSLVVKWYSAPIETYHGKLCNLDLVQSR